MEFRAAAARAVLACSLLAATAALPCRLAAGEAVDFNRDIRPILSENCFHCHGPDPATREAGLRLDLEPEAKADLGGAFAIAPGDPGRSLLWQRVAHEDAAERMPPPKSKRVLSAAEKDLLRRWIEDGAPYQRHWAYDPPLRPRAPLPQEPATAARARNDIDRFLFTRLEEAGLAPSPEASRATLIRRVTLDLTGLPPTPEETAAFLADDSEDAWERLVDRLLRSQRFGEHWARAWLDLARYADSNGFQADQLRESWAYRDWVIGALNANLPYDRFTIEQLAGDLLPGATLEQKIATGFHRTVTCNVEAGVHPEENRVNQVFDRVNTTGTVWLAATLECAQCHDHKYDPFSMRDYYQIFAYFNNTPLEVENASGQGVQFEFTGPLLELPMPPERQAGRKRVEGGLAAAKAERQALAAALEPERAGWEAGLLASASQEARKGALEIAESAGSAGEVAVTASEDLQKGISPELLAILRKPAGERSRQETGKLEELWIAARPGLAALDREAGRLEKELEALAPSTTLVMVEMEEPRQTRVLERGDYLSPGEEVAAGTPAALHAPAPGLPPDRLGLAQWLVDPANPLVARVAVNRWWAQVFGQGISRTLEDFGTQSDPPSHPGLLDWLAVEFMESGWDMKHALKAMVMSAAYRQDTRLTSLLAEIDPENRLISRGPRFRMSAEMIRDQALAAAGLLSPRMHGPPVMPYQPPGIWRQVGRNEPVWQEAVDEDRWRRGVYVVWRRAAPYPSFVNFDGPDRASCAVDRPRTNTPLQALTLLNDPAYVEMALALAHRVLSEGEGETEAVRLDRAFAIALGRAPAPAEREALSGLLERRLAAYREDPAAARAVVEGAKGHFQPRPGIDPALLAAWFFVANTLLNLDETVTKG